MSDLRPILGEPSASLPPSLTPTTPSLKSRITQVAMRILSTLRSFFVSSEPRKAPVKAVRDLDGGIFVEASKIVKFIMPLFKPSAPEPVAIKAPPIKKPLKEIDYKPRTSQTLTPALATEVEQAHKSLHEENNTPQGVEKNLFLSIGSSRIRSKDAERMKELEGSQGERQFIDIYDYFQQFADTTEGAERQNVANTLKVLDEAAPLFIIDSQSHAAKNALFHAQLESLKPGESRIISLSGSTEEAGHAMLLEFTREADGTFTLMLFNTGHGVGRYHSMAPNNRFYPYALTGIPLSKLDENFLSHLFVGQIYNGPKHITSITRFYAFLEGLQTHQNTPPLQVAIDIEKAIDPSAFPDIPRSQSPEELAAFLQLAENAVLRFDLRQRYSQNPKLPQSLKSALDTPLPSSLQQRYQPYFEQGQIGNCTYKCLSTWMRRFLSPSLYQKFKAFKLSLQIEKLEALAKTNPTPRIQKVLNDAKTELAHSESRSPESLTFPLPRGSFDAGYSEYLSSIEDLCKKSEFSEALKKTKVIIGVKDAALAALMIILKNTPSSIDSSLIVEMVDLFCTHEAYEIASQLLNKLPEGPEKTKSLNQFYEKVSQAYKEKRQYFLAATWANKLPPDDKGITLLELISVMRKDGQRQDAPKVAAMLSDPEDIAFANEMLSKNP